MTRKPRTLSEAVDRAIAAENAAFLANPEAIAEAQADGDRYRKQLEDQGILPRVPEWRKRLTARDETSRVIGND